MTQGEEKVVQTLTNTLVKILNAGEKENITEENRRTGILDCLKLCYLMYNKAIQNKDTNPKQIFNTYQNLFFRAINEAHKQVPKDLRMINITNSLFRDFLITLFKAQGEEDLLKDLTGYTSKNLIQDKITEDMKIMFISVAKQEEEQK